MRRVGSVRLTGARRLRLPSPVPGGEVGCPWQRHRLLHSRSWSGGACGTRPDRVSCRLASLCQVVTIATAARARACHALLILPSSPPETLGCEDIRFVVVLGSDPCDLHRGEKGWRVRRLFAYHEGSQRRMEAGRRPPPGGARRRESQRRFFNPSVSALPSRVPSPAILARPASIGSP